MENTNTNTNYTQYADYKKKQSELAGLMDSAAGVISELNMNNYKQNLESLAEKVHNETFKIMVVGTFKNGKSTFINSFLGESVLPAYAIPTTAVINEVKWGKDKKAVVHFKNPLPETLPTTLPAKALEHISSFNKTDVPPLEIPYDEIEAYAVIPFGSSPSEMILESPYEKIELFWPLPLLENGIEIIDSPGLNEHETRTKVTMDYLAKADAILFVLNSLAACSQEEMRFIENNLKSQGFTDPFFVVNRFDCIPEGQREMMKNFVNTKLKGYSSNEIHFVSALNALEGKQQNDDAKFEASGMKAFEERLSEFLTKEKGKAKLAQPARELKRILNDEALFKVIPSQRAILSTSLDEVKARYEKAQPALADLKIKKEQVYNKLLLRIEQSKPEFRRAIAHNYTTLVDSIAAWVDETEPQTKIGLVPTKDKISAVTTEISDIVIEKIEDNQIEWKTSVLEPLIREKGDELLGSVEADVDAIFAEIDTINVDVSGKEYDTNSVPTWQRVAGVLGGLALGDLGLAFSGGMHGIGKEFVKTLALECGAYFILGALGLFNPVTFIAVIAAAILGNMWRGQNQAVEKIKLQMKDELIKQISETSEANTDNIVNSITEKFIEVSKLVTTALDTEITETENQIKAIIEEMDKGNENINERNNIISKCEEDAKELSGKLDNLIFSLVEE
ncbi:MAG: dynamin family protein [Clostridia bacterium]|nr:dynamin family protein [Clostridia bacterium]